MTTTTTAHLRRAADIEVLSGDPNGSIALLADAGDTGGALTAHRSAFRNGADGAPPHRHTLATELFVVLDGVLEVLLDDEIVVLETGDVLSVPPMLPHAFGAARGRGAEVLFVLTPGRPRADYYRLLDRVHRGETDPREIGASQERFDNHYVDSPLWRSARA
jgi:quercetin dioxygenase-like cupin family protein